MIGTRVGLADGQSLHRVGLAAVVFIARIILINRTEVTNVDAQSFDDVEGSTEANRVTVASKRGVALILIAKAVVGTLGTG